MGLEGTSAFNQGALVQGKPDTDGLSASQGFIDIVRVWFCYLGLQGSSPRHAFYFVCFVPSVLLCLCLLTLIVTLGGAERFGGHRRVKCSVGLAFL